MVTGATKGIGRATALRLDGAGWRVFAGFRKEADAEGLRREASERLVPVRLDVTEAGAIEEAAETVGEQVGGEGLRGLVNNAGVALAAPLEFIPIDAFREQVEVNLTAQLAVTQAFLPLLRRAHPAGRVVNISSVGGRVGGPTIGAYHASKWGLEGMSESLRVELRPWGIWVSLIEPGMIATPIWSTASAAADRLMERMPPRAVELYGPSIEAARENAATATTRGIPPDAVARAVEKTLTARRPRDRYLVGTDARMGALVVAHLPARLRDRLLGGPARRAPVTAVDRPGSAAEPTAANG